MRFIKILIGVYLIKAQENAFVKNQVAAASRNQRNSVTALSPPLQSAPCWQAPLTHVAIMRAYLSLFMLAGVSALRPYAGIAAPRLPLAASVRMSDAPATAGGIDWAQTAKYPLAAAAQAGLIATFFRAVDACGR